MKLQSFYAASIIAVCALLTLLAGPALAAQGKPLTKETAQRLLGAMLQGAKVQSVAKAPIKGTWELVFTTSSGEKAVVYMDDRKDHLFVGSILDLKSRTNLTQMRVDDLNRIAFDSIPLDDALVMGNPKAKQKVIIFDDPD